MDIKHTPGPWHLHSRILHVGPPHSAVAAKTLVARVFSEAYGDIAQETANAHLIATAPEPLEALQHVVRWHDQLGPADIERFRATIAKATGVSA